MTQNKKNGFQLYKRLLNNTKIYKGIFSIAVIGMIIHALTDTSFAAIIKPLLDGSFIDKDPGYQADAFINNSYFYIQRHWFLHVIIWNGLCWTSIIRDIRKEMFDKKYYKDHRHYMMNLLQESLCLK